MNCKYKSLVKCSSGRRKRTYKILTLLMIYINEYNLDWRETNLLYRIFSLIIIILQGYHTERSTTHWVFTVLILATDVLPLQCTAWIHSWDILCLFYCSKIPFRRMLKATRALRDRIVNDKILQRIGCRTFWELESILTFAYRQIVELLARVLEEFVDERNARVRQRRNYIGHLIGGIVVAGRT